jgi:hypothetical protein
MEARARIYKRGRMWHWYLIILTGAGHAHVYNGDERSRGLAQHMAQMTYHLHKRSTEKGLDNLAA